LSHLPLLSKLPICDMAEATPEEDPITRYDITRGSARALTIICN